MTKPNPLKATTVPLTIPQAEIVRQRLRTILEQIDEIQYDDPLAMRSTARTIRDAALQALDRMP